MTPLQLAAVQGKVAAIQALLAAKADVYATDDVREGRRALGDQGVGCSPGSQFCYFDWRFSTRGFQQIQSVHHGPNLNP